jgi:predicted  nucleic acid-binding Zn-ribbon protein
MSAQLGNKMRKWLANDVTQTLSNFSLSNMPSARQYKDVATRLDELQHLVKQIQQEIEALRSQGEVAPSGCWIVRF